MPDDPVLLAELRVRFLVPRNGPEAADRAALRVLKSPEFRRAVRRAVARRCRRDPILARTTVRLAR